MLPFQFRRFRRSLMVPFCVAFLLFFKFKLIEIYHETTCCPVNLLLTRLVGPVVARSTADRHVHDLIRIIHWPNENFILVQEMDLRGSTRSRCDLVH